MNGEPVVFECKIFSGHTTLTPLQEAQKMIEKNNIRPEEFQDRIILHVDVQ